MSEESKTDNDNDRCPVCDDGPKTTGHLTFAHSTFQLAKFIVDGTKSKRDDTFAFIFGGAKTRAELRKKWKEDG